MFDKYGVGIYLSVFHQSKLEFNLISAKTRPLFVNTFESSNATDSHIVQCAMSAADIGHWTRRTVRNNMLVIFIVIVILSCQR